ncbi:type II secretion system protein [Deinococcus frigens]|uniref:type II secretion system protein n=1 Tax=Deinococcus frigens TaxID=249403 RepID=UPI0004952826|nr:prepilin-type N-terminal cleavage/methylation domain-containing protein [Deinococcus frigens]
MRARTNANRIQAGFTLLELLVVIAILGIIAGAFGLFLIRSLRQSELRDAAYQMIGDLRRARTGAQKMGVDNAVAITPNTSEYLLAVGGGTGQVRTLPHRVKVSPVGNTNLLTYKPPFGTLDTIGVSWKLTSPADPSLNLWVKAIGITGKVMLSATQD